MSPGQRGGRRICCQWTLTVHRADLALEDAVTDAAADFTSKTGVPVFRGTPE